MGTLKRLWQAFFVAIVLLLLGPQAQNGQTPPRQGADSNQVATLEGAFGKAEVDLVSPALLRLQLRGPAGLSEQSVLAGSGPRLWAHGGYTYVVGQDNRRYESRLARPQRAEVKGEGNRTVVQLVGVKLSAGPTEEPLATEDWTLSAPGDGRDLVWEITRRWLKDSTSVYSGSPALFFSFNARELKNAVTSTIWYDPLHLSARSSELYDLQPGYVGRISQNHIQTIRERNAWVIYKLWTNWHSPSDLRLEVAGGHLYRRGSYALLSEAGAVTTPEPVQKHRAGQVERITLRISPANKKDTGYQLAITLPDKATEESLKDFYSSVFNGGAINDQKSFDFGNETDGWYYAGSSWMHGMLLEAGVPAAGQLSSHGYDAVRAMRENLAHIFSVMDGQGRAHFGYNQPGEWVDDNLHTISGTYAYLLHSGDLAFVRQDLPSLEHMLAYFMARRDASGLFKLDNLSTAWYYDTVDTFSTAHWYYDAIDTSGVNGYYNAFFYEAADDLAEMESAAGREEKAEEYRAVAGQIKKAYNEVLWKEDAPGGPRYLDWIDAHGREVSYFCDICQWPAIALGIAPPERARKVIATADARIEVLKRDFGYQGFATLSALWPVPQETIASYLTHHDFGTYMNGGSLLAQTYWEIMARARYGDPEGAARLLKMFARRAAEISWAGDNAADIHGEMKGGDREPYLADMVVTTAAAVQGLLGITLTWQRLEVNPHLPVEWGRAEAEVLYKGRRHRVVIEDGKVRIYPREQVIDLPLSWTMDFNLRTSPGGPAKVSNVDFSEPYGDSIALHKQFDDEGALGIWKLGEQDGPVQDGSPHQNSGTLKGKGILRGEAGHNAAGKSYRFDGHSAVQILDRGTFSFDSSESFTVQCWVKTESDGMLLVKPGAYAIYLLGGKVAAWLMQFDGQTREATGSQHVSDGAWHHVAAVFDRQRQRLALYVDGKLDTPDGASTAQNPVDISALGASRSAEPIMLGCGSMGLFKGGSVGSGLTGWLDEVSIFHGALRPEEFSFERDYPAAVGTSKLTYAAAGSYQSPPQDWVVRAKLAELTVAADLNGGQANATVEASDDAFTTVSSSRFFPVQDGVNTYPLSAMQSSARMVRIRFDLVRGPRADTTPVIDAFRVVAAPEKIK
jgi:hypothetical protein